MTLALSGCSIESHDSRLDYCLKGHDEIVKNSGERATTMFVCDEYDLPIKDEK